MNAEDSPGKGDNKRYNLLNFKVLKNNEKGRFKSFIKGGGERLLNLNTAVKKTN